MKHLEALAERCCINQMQKSMLFSNGEYPSMPQNVLQHTNTSNTELLISKTRYQSIVSYLSLYRFFLKLFSNNEVPRVITETFYKGCFCNSKAKLFFIICKILYISSIHYFWSQEFILYREAFFGSTVTTIFWV